MNHFSVWAFAWALALCAAAVAAWVITSEREQPAAREPIRVQLEVLQLGSYELPKPRTWAALAEIPPHVIKRSQPLCAEEVEHVRGHVRYVVEAPETPSAIPLWDAYREDQQRAARRRAAEAASAGWPDPGYTYEGAHHYAGTVA